MNLGNIFNAHVGFGLEIFSIESQFEFGSSQDLDNSHLIQTFFIISNSIIFIFFLEFL